MKTTQSILAVLAGVALLAACGRPSTDNRFDFDGSGDPHLPAGTIIPGKFAGNIEIGIWKSAEVNYQAVFGGNDVLLMQSIFNSGEIAGLGGFPVLVLGSSPPPRNGVDPAFPCYYDLGPLPELGGSIDSLDVGPAVHAEFQAATLTGDLNRQPDAPNGPASDVLFYYGAYDGTGLSDNDIAIKWDGGTLAGLGYPHAPLRSRNDVEIRQPPAVNNILVNGTALTSNNIANASSYQISWTPWNGAGAVQTPDNVNGMEIVAQIYGPADLSSDTKTEVEDWPWFNKLGQLVCIVDDSSGTFTMQQAWLDELLARVMDTSAYAHSTEDVNHDGVLSPRTGNATTGFSGEDANGNHQDDKIYGTVLFVNRRTENRFIACLKGSDEVNNCTKAGNVFISGNDLNYARMKYAAP
jgi:hypothetical protein